MLTLYPGRDAQVERYEELDRETYGTLFRGLIRRNQAPDFVLDRGHVFGSELSDDDKRALIEFMKTF